MKNFLKQIFSRGNKTSLNAPVNSEFIHTHNSHHQSDFEVSELSYDEYVTYAGPERRVVNAEIDEERRHQQ